MATVIENVGTYQRDFDKLQAREGEAARWLRPLREPAMRQFVKLGFPTIRNEEWRFTNVKAIAGAAFVLPDAVAGDEVRAAAVEPFLFPGATGVVLVFVDGFYRADLSRVGDPGLGVTATSLAHGLALHHDLVLKHLGDCIDYEQDAFSALNTAFLDEGVFVHVGEGVDLAEPVHILNLATGTGKLPRVMHPRNLIVAETGGRLNVIEHYAALPVRGGEDSSGEGKGSSPPTGVYWSNAITEVIAGENSQVHHYLIENESERAFNINTLAVRQESNSKFESHTVLLGGALVRNNVQVELAGTGCESLVNGLFLGHGTQHMDNHMRIVHAAEHCNSRQFYKGILDQRAHGVFTGRIIVKPGAQKTDAKQTNRNLLLSDDAQIDTRPQLEIYADDVKCTHGATTGQLDQDAIFYMRARGISAESARALLIYAFAQESLHRMSLPTVRRALGAMLFERLPQAGLLRSLVGAGEAGTGELGAGESNEVEVEATPRGVPKRRIEVFGTGVADP